MSGAPSVNGTTVFDELAASVLGIMTPKNTLNQFYAISEDNDKVKVLSKTVAAAFAAGILGSVLTPSGIVVALFTGVLALSHFVRTVSIADQAVQSVQNHLSLFNELAETPTDICYLGAFKRFLEIPTREAQALTATKAAGVAAAIGLFGKMLGFSGTSLFVISAFFTFAHFTRKLEQVVVKAAEQPAEQQPAAVVDQS